MNEQLRELYQKNYPIVAKEVKSIKSEACSPLLVKVNEEYINSEVKVIIFGQETDGWYGCFNETQHDIDKLMSGYHDYLRKISPNGKKRSKRAFWNGKNFAYFERNLILDGKRPEFIWNNISKIGNLGRGKPEEDIRRLERAYFNVIREEVEILSPDLIIFTTGKRDGYIKHHFGNSSEFIPKLYLEDGAMVRESSNLIAEVKLELFPDILAIRVEHPNRRSLRNSIILDVIQQCWLKHKVN
ncbi:hypothetical protein [Desulfosediminicola ganghwensis]|uniref:hypothetical protein n=1 Tax=Desulfosediminicola ganghwensis TaxID=2569540 RepID=UPI0010ACA4CC|nr:hypothetical protein [Desulfosediminicola ganghwensis]